MPAMDTKDYLSLLAICISIVSLLLTLMFNRRTHTRSVYDACDSAIREILKIQLDHPEYRDKATCDALLDKATNDKDRLRVEAYIILCYNMLETLYEKYGAESLGKSHFAPVLRRIAERHRKWLFMDDHFQSCDPGMINFLLRQK